MGRVWSARVVAAQDILWMYVDRKTKINPRRIKRKVVLDVEEVETLLPDAMPHAIRTARLEIPTKPETQSGQAQTLARKLQRRTDGAPQQSNNFSKVCYRCGAEGHLARNCTTAPTIPHAHIPDTKTTGNNAGKDSLATYTMEVGARKCSVITVTPKARELVEVCIDERSFIRNDDDDVTPLPLYHLLAQEYVEKEVFVVPKLSTKEVKKPTGCLWVMSETPKGQQLLTIWDTGAVVCVAPKSLMVQTKTKWTQGADIDFVMADGVMRSPIGIAESFVFRIKDKYFAVRCYVVALANYQLLLGTESS